MSQQLEMTALLQQGSRSCQQEDQTTRAEQSAVEGGWAEFHLSDARNHIGIRLKLGNSNSVVEVKAIKQADNSVVLRAVFMGCTSSSVATITPQQEPTHAMPQQDLGQGNNNPVGEETEWVKKMRGWLMVLATIVLSVTYQAGINPPGGVWQDDVESNITAGIIGHTAGVPIYQDTNPKSFTVFKWSNTLAMAQSLVILLLLIKRTTFQYSDLYVHALRVLVVTSLLALATAYSVSDPGYRATLVFYLLFANAVLTLLLLLAVNKWRNSVTDATKEKVRTYAKRGILLLYCIIWTSSTVLIVLEMILRSHQTLFSIVLSFLFAAATIIWVV